MPPEDFKDGRAEQGYNCNADLVSHTGLVGGFRVERYVDAQKHVCAFYDSTRLLGADFAGQIKTNGVGTYAVDMTDPAKPVVTATMTTPAMVTPHESLRLNQKRGLLVAHAGNPASSPGTIDVWDVHADCRHPVQAASYPIGLFGHESAFSPDGRTFYVSDNGGHLSAVDLTDPTAPSLLWSGDSWGVHGLSASSDGNTLYLAATDAQKGLTLLDVSEIQSRRPNPQAREISRLQWPEVSIPQNATPFTSGGHQYLIETDEYGGGSTPVGGARIINIDNPKQPKVTSRLRLAVHNKQDANFTAHYCTVPSRIDPYIIACGMIASGLRVFDIRDPAHPKEVAYANFLQFHTEGNQLTNGVLDSDSTGSAFAAPAYDPTRNDIWFTDGLRGFFVVHLTPASGVTKFARTYVLPGS